MRVEYNVVYNILGTAMVTNHDNFGHIIQNNVFALCGGLISRSGDPGPMDSTGTVYRNVFYYNSNKMQKFFIRILGRTTNRPWTIISTRTPPGKPPTFLGMGFEQWKKKTTEYWAKTIIGKTTGATAIRSWPIRCS